MTRIVAIGFFLILGQIFGCSGLYARGLTLEEVPGAFHVHVTTSQTKVLLGQECYLNVTVTYKANKPYLQDKLSEVEEFRVRLLHDASEKNARKGRTERVLLDREKRNSGSFYPDSIRGNGMGGNMNTSLYLPKSMNVNQAEQLFLSKEDNETYRWATEAAFGHASVYSGERTVVLPLSEYWIIDSPGKYKLRVDMLFWSLDGKSEYYGSLPSNTIEVEFVPKDASTEAKSQ